MTTVESAASDQTWGRSVIRRLAWWWKQVRMLYQVLVLVRFSLLLGVVCALVMLLNDQAQDVLRLLGEDTGWPVVWFLLAGVLSAAVAWWSARVMFYFRFRNPASAPHVFHRVKEQLPRALGAAVLVLTALALAQVSFSYDGWVTGPAGRLRLLALLLLLLAVGFVYGTVKRRVWFADLAGGPRPSNLRSLRELHWQGWVPLVVAATFGFALMVLFAYRAVEVAPYFGTATVAMLAVTGLIPVGSFLVYLGNRASLPVVSLVLIWAALSTYLVDNHYVRLYAGMDSYRLPEPPPAASAPRPDIGAYLTEWASTRTPTARGTVPAVIVSAEGGGIHAAYWSALVLGELQDRPPPPVSTSPATSSRSAASPGARSGRRPSRPWSRTKAPDARPSHSRAVPWTRGSMRLRCAGASSVCWATTSCHQPSP